MNNALNDIKTDAEITVVPTLSSHISESLQQDGSFKHVGPKQRLEQFLQQHFAFNLALLANWL